MGRTKIVIEIESANEPYLKSLGEAMVEAIRTFIKYSQRYARVTDVETNITHDGKNVTEVIQ